MCFDEKAFCNESTGVKFPTRLLKSPSIMDFGVATIFLPEDPNKLCDRLRLLLQSKQAGNISHTFNEEIIAVADSLLEYKCIYTQQHKVLLVKCVNQT